MKPWFKSKTFWLQILTLVLGVLAVVGQSELIPPKTVLVITSLVVPIVNVFLRWLTDRPITSINPHLDKLRPHIYAADQARRYRA